jgi:hypothetical protein
MNGEGEQSQSKHLHVLPKPSFGCVWEECIVIAFGENLEYKYVQMNAPSSIRKSKSPTREWIKSPPIDGAHRHRLRYEGGAPPDAESYFIQLLQSELREPTLTRRLKPVIPAVEALFATLHDVVHPLDEKRSVHINKAVIKKLNAAIRQVWAQAGPILRTAGYYDADDDVLQLEIEEVFQRYMRQLVSHLIIRTLGTPADLERNRDAPMIRRLLVSFSKVLVDHMGPSYDQSFDIKGITVSFRDVLDAMLSGSILENSKPTVWPNRGMDGGAYKGYKGSYYSDDLKGSTKAVIFLVFAIMFTLLFKPSLETRPVTSFATITSPITIPLGWYILSEGGKNLMRRRRRLANIDAIAEQKTKFFKSIKDKLTETQFQQNNANHFEVWFRNLENKFKDDYNKKVVQDRLPPWDDWQEEREEVMKESKGKFDEAVSKHAKMQSQKVNQKAQDQAPKKVVPTMETLLKLEEELKNVTGGACSAHSRVRSPHLQRGPRFRTDLF